MGLFSYGRTPAHSEPSPGPPCRGGEADQQHTAVLGHPHTFPSETSRKALGQPLATSSVEHAEKCERLAGEKGSGW